MAISEIAMKVTFISLLQLISALPTTYTPHGRLFIFKAEISIVSTCLELKRVKRKVVLVVLFRCNDFNVFYSFLCVLWTIVRIRLMVMRCCISAGYLHRLLATGAKLVLYGLYI